MVQICALAGVLNSNGTFQTRGGLLRIPLTMLSPAHRGVTPGGWYQHVLKLPGWEPHIYVFVELETWNTWWSLTLWTVISDTGGSRSLYQKVNKSWKREICKLITMEPTGPSFVSSSGATQAPRSDRTGSSYMFSDRVKVTERARAVAVPVCRATFQRAEALLRQPLPWFPTGPLNSGGCARF